MISDIPLRKHKFSFIIQIKLIDLQVFIADKILSINFILQISHFEMSGKHQSSKNQPKKHHGLCLVCGDISIGINFGVPTCMPCKAFFRRNAVRLGLSQQSSIRF